MGRLLRFIGGLEEVVQPNDSVFLKINHLGNHASETAINTHPQVVSSFARTLGGVTTNITVGDGLDSTDEAPFATSGFSRMCRQDGLRLLNFCRRGYLAGTVNHPHALEQVPIPTSVTEADVVVSLPKLKTHMLTLLTGAVKNNYGYLPLQVRLRLHREHIEPTDFCGAVVDAYAACVPAFTLMDAIDALEGTGPGAGGRPRHLGLLLAGADGVAVDAVASAIIGLDPMSVATTRIAHERGLGVGDLSQIEVVGESIWEVRRPDFAKPSSRLLPIWLAHHLPVGLTRLIGSVAGATRPWPRVSAKRCTGCGTCVKHCPQDAITLPAGKARINTDECISCFCCLEFCPSDVIKPTRSQIGSVLAGAAACASHAVKGIKKLLAHIRS